MNTPGFTAEVSLNVRSNISHREAINSVDGPIADYVVPASRAGACRRMLKECLSQPNPRHPACDFWIILC
jgi:hypothetical protein